MLLILNTDWEVSNFIRLRRHPSHHSVSSSREVQPTNSRFAASCSKSTLTPKTQPCIGQYIVLYAYHSCYGSVRGTTVVPAEQQGRYLRTYVDRRSESNRAVANTCLSVVWFGRHCGFFLVDRTRDIIRSSTHG